MIIVAFMIIVAWISHSADQSLKGALECHRGTAKVLKRPATEGTPVGSDAFDIMGAGAQQVSRPRLECIRVPPNADTGATPADH